ncbi:hypothetical protein R1flu_020169 [Riccia fluitans]|uniref:DUF4238 domain-containing protein n=1 Tax=Riccia fluitans TaxID=41844 RepID=A0ABD1ZMX7_9MARC
MSRRNNQYDYFYTLRNYPDGYLTEHPGIPTPPPLPPRSKNILRRTLYDRFKSIISIDSDKDLCDLYQKLITDSIGREDDLDLDDALYEIERLLLSIEDDVIIDSVLENYPDGFPEARPIAPPTFATYILSPYVLDLCRELGVSANTPPAWED